MGQTIIGAPQMFGRGAVVDPTIAPLASANVIAPTDIMHRITGNTVIKTITPPSQYFNGPIYFFSTDVGGCTWDATGNIAIAGTMTRFLMFAFIYDPAVGKWYPDTIA